MTPQEKLEEIENSILDLRLPAFGGENIYIPQYDIEPKRKDVPLSKQDIDFLLGAEGNLRWLIARVRQLEDALGAIKYLGNKDRAAVIDYFFIEQALTQDPLECNDGKQEEK